MSDQTVALTILQQLGGNRFTVMTGSKNYLSTENSLAFKVGRNAKKVTHVRITLTPDDLYDVEFLDCRTTAKRLIHEVKEKAEGVYCDQLQAVFTDGTGLYTRL